MDEIPGLNMLPEKWRPFALFFVLWLMPNMGRAYHAIRNNGGLRGVWNAIMFGTNTPNQPPKP